MTNPGDQQLLTEIRDLLKEQTRIMTELKAQNDLIAAKSIEHMAKAEAIARKQMAQSEAALGQAGWLKWGFWGFLALLLLLFAAPSLWQAFGS